METKNKTNKYVCSLCKGENIEIRSWVDANTDKVLDTCSDGDIEDNWCRDCNKHTNFSLIEKNGN